MQRTGSTSGIRASWRGRREWRDPLLEVLLVDSGRCIRLGPYFGLEESACVVINGYDDARKVCQVWLDGADIASVVAGASFLNRRDLSKLQVVE